MIYLPRRHDLPLPSPGRWKRLVRLVRSLWLPRLDPEDIRFGLRGILLPWNPQQDDWHSACQHLARITPCRNLRAYTLQGEEMGFSNLETGLLRGGVFGQNLNERLRAAVQWPLWEHEGRLSGHHDEIRRARHNFSREFRDHRQLVSNRYMDSLICATPECELDHAEPPRPAPDLISRGEALALIRAAMAQRKPTDLLPAQALCGWAWPQTALLPSLGRLAYSSAQIRLLAKYQADRDHVSLARAVASRWGGWPGDVG